MRTVARESPFLFVFPSSSRSPALLSSESPLPPPSPIRSELLFYPFKEWYKKGPVTSLYHTFVWSNIPIHSKVSVTAYISSYYAIAIAAFMSTANWIIVGIWSSSLDKFYLESWQVFLTCVVVFCGLSNVCSAVSLSDSLSGFFE